MTGGSVKRGQRGFPFIEQFKQLEAELARCRKALGCDHWEDKDLWRPVFVGVETFQRCDECGLMERWAGGMLFEQGFDFPYTTGPVRNEEAAS